MDEYLELLNAKNYLVKKEDYLNTKEALIENQQRFDEVQSQVAKLIEQDGWFGIVFMVFGRYYVKGIKRKPFCESSRFSVKCSKAGFAKDCFSSCTSIILSNCPRLFSN